MGHKHTKPKKINKKNELIIRHEHPQCSIDDFIGWINKNTTVLDFYNKISGNGTTTYCDINERTQRDFYLLHFACQAENVPIAKALIYSGAYINKLNVGKLTPLDFALHCDNLKLIQLLVNSGGITLHGISAYLKNSAERLKDLDINKISKGKVLAVREYLLTNQIKDFGNINYEKYPIFQLAIENKDIDVVKDMLGNYMFDANGNQYESSIRILTRKHQANISNYLDMIKLLVKHGAVIIEDSDWGDTTSVLARKLGHYDIAEFLDQTQKERYQKLEEQANLQQKYYLFYSGLFFDKKSNLHTQLGKQSDISHEVMRKMIAFEYS